MSSLQEISFGHAGAALVGLAAFPDGPGPHPAVLVMHNALGLGEQVKRSAQRLAALGYIAIATDMYGGGAGTDGAVSAYTALHENTGLIRERAVAWFDHVAAMPQVDAQRVAAIGYCFGGQCVLELARSGADVKVVVSYHGLLTTPTPAQPGAVRGQVAAYCGRLDPFAPLEHITALREEFEAAGAHFQLTIFGDAAHGFTDPDAGAMGRPGIAYDRIADRVSWAGTVALLETVLKG
jgi:dienelactone hydrolase